MLSQVPLKSLHDKGFALKIYAENRWNFGLRHDKEQPLPNSYPDLIN